MSIIQYLQDEYINKINSDIEGVFQEGLKLKGYEFNNSKDLHSFIKHRCYSSEYHDGIRTFYANEEPFMLLFYHPKVDFDINRLRDSKISLEIDLGYYKFI